MKKRMAFVFALILVLGLAACSAQEQQEEAPKYDRIPMVMVDGGLYLDTGHTSLTDSRNLTADGTITSEVSGSEVPMENDQSNFASDVPYRFGEEGTVELYLNDKWRIFATEEVRQQIQFPENDAVSRDTAVLKEPSALTVVYGEESIEALRGTSSWMYENDDGTWTGIEADSMHPLEAKEYMPSLNLLPVMPSFAVIQWDTLPDKVSVRCWDEAYWGHYDAESEEVPAKLLCIDSSDGCDPYFSVDLKDGSYVYEVIAEWNRAERYSGKACYSFYTVKPDLEEHPL